MNSNIYSIFIVTACLSMTGCEQDSIINDSFAKITHFFQNDKQSQVPIATSSANQAQGITTINSDELVEIPESRSQIMQVTDNANSLNGKKFVKPQKKLTPVEQVRNSLQSSDLFLMSANGLANLDTFHLRKPIKAQLTPNVSQQFLGVTDIEQRLSESLPEIPYSTNNLSAFAQQVNSTGWYQGKPLDQATIIKIQALLNWNSHSVGAIDGNYSQNTLKALHAFQKARGIKPTNSINIPTWNFLTAKKGLLQRPVLVNYTLTKKDVAKPYKTGSEFKSRLEALGEKFHMSRAMINRLNPNLQMKAGNVITVFNPGQPNEILVDRVVVYKRKNLLVAYDAQDKVVATYPTTVGNRSPTGIHSVVSRVIKPSYNSGGFKDRAKTKAPGPNNPVGMVWIALSKPTFGIHGSPEPEKISRQRSAGCVRLTNWDALSLYGTIKLRAKVIFKNS